MTVFTKGTIAVIFCARRTDADDSGYADAADRMEKLAALQSGYRGIDHARNADGSGITISYWATDDDAKAWRDNPEHAAIRETGRGKWYSSYSLHVARVERSYDWEK
ncbi:antibiotic biosynthesis monooxygenase family protein [Parasphingorhabdus marina]|nr:antibiotic biosynthesis monooxygenase [Parasphingorhabdus marina]